MHSDLPVTKLAQALYGQLNRAVVLFSRAIDAVRKDADATPCLWAQAKSERAQLSSVFWQVKLRVLGRARSLVHPPAIQLGNRIRRNKS
jgi:hypothetical protein